MTYDLNVMYDSAVYFKRGADLDQRIDTAVGKHSWASGCDLRDGGERDLAYEFESATDAFDAQQRASALLVADGVRHRLELLLRE